jgi:hypothetical protein
LDTSFVNLSALVKFLRRRQFVGTVSIQLNGYQAEILIKEDRQLRVREHDQISGRISDGEEAFQRLLIRAREPGGTINVFQYQKESVKNTDKAAKRTARTPAKPPQEAIVDARIVESPMVKPAEFDFPAPANGNGSAVKNGHSNGNGGKTQPVAVKNSPTPKTPLPDFPFTLSNKVENKAKSFGLETSEWQLLLKLSVEILGVVDRSLANHNLDFSAAFRKARIEISEDYTFMRPELGIFDYKDGRVTMKSQINETVYINSIVEGLKRIIERLEQIPKFSELSRDTSHLLLALIQKRKPQYDRFGLTVPLKRMLGV